jgi:hypothetical protein
MGSHSFSREAAPEIAELSGLTDLVVDFNVTESRFALARTNADDP